MARLCQEFGKMQKLVCFGRLINRGSIFHGNNISVRAASNTGGKSPPIKPPGSEWIDQGWKDDGTGLGDYPNYQEWSYQNRDPNLKYWDQQERRHFGEPLHVNHDALNVWMPDDMTNHKYSHGEMALHLGIALSLLGAVVWYSEYVYDAPSRNPAVPKPYPYNNLYLELGGDPEKNPTEADLKRKIPRPHFGW
ncbi:NADH dehydrogenase [ubiquinone] 1 beta subcomplex subunit 8, mitochondrial-like [Hydractinia symbiolongicarpus]|uniref:NADH dehydrogenase [ubiquinone] 1 beta subcomplex subunit 8, mitochondrial-like n=1 Tax=Hydractinia symbiolongicarpus TaxID=13093 RepID=UPI00254C40C4|nr:NADH dehydrogenase [ubiquinone] 1 beta subcomplex subunit 8, mitochondrial-like [Hydractinia symbiolongicarpus]